MSFEEALSKIKSGKGVMRLTYWKPDVFISIQIPDEHSKMTHPYLYISSRFGKIPWMPTVVELFSEAWAYHEDYQGGE